MTEDVLEVEMRMKVTALLTGGEWVAQTKLKEAVVKRFGKDGVPCFYVVLTKMKASGTIEEGRQPFCAGSLKRMENHYRRRS